ncbi:hypothetical protein HOE37_06725 [Candidatus Woesearchaeota archaeon]|jgi:hypothetical protein|nr:hypothetical protein [Candidatus Woesearchaeota archaeon]
MFKPYDFSLNLKDANNSSSDSLSNSFLNSLDKEEEESSFSKESKVEDYEVKDSDLEEILLQGSFCVIPTTELKIRNKPYISKQESFNIVFIDLTKEII